MDFFKIVGFSVLIAIAYGIGHDFFTANICVEYFTIGHPPVFPTQSPWLLALGWGVLATWWVGLILGLLLAACARFGTMPRLGFAVVRPLVLWLVPIMAFCAFLGGLAGGLLGNAGYIYLEPEFVAALLPATYLRFQIDLWAHSASYLSGFVGGIVCSILLIKRRRGLGFTHAT